MIFIWAGKPDFREGQVEKLGQNGKLSFFQGNQEQLFQFCSGRIEARLLHILDPNYLLFYLKCPRKCQKTYNFDIFQTVSQICTSPPPKFWTGFKI